MMNLLKCSLLRKANYKNKKAKTQCKLEDLFPNLKKNSDN